jgi:hypothetical protein
MANLSSGDKAHCPTLEEDKAALAQAALLPSASQGPGVEGRSPKMAPSGRRYALRPGTRGNERRGHGIGFSVLDLDLVLNLLLDLVLGFCLVLVLGFAFGFSFSYRPDRSRD